MFAKDLYLTCQIITEGFRRPWNWQMHRSISKHWFSVLVFLGGFTNFIPQVKTRIPYHVFDYPHPPLPLSGQFDFVPLFYRKNRESFLFIGKKGRKKLS